MNVNYEPFLKKGGELREKSEMMPEPAVFLTCLMKKSPWIRDTRPKLVYLKTWSINHIIFRTTWNGKKKQWKSMTKTQLHIRRARPQPPPIFPKVTTCSAAAPFITTRINWAGMHFISIGQNNNDDSTINVLCPKTSPQDIRRHANQVQHDLWQGQWWTSDAVTGPHLTDELL